MSSQTVDDCQINDPNNIFPIESLRFPLDSSMRMVFTGYFNGFSVEVRSLDEIALLYHMGCFGKGSFSRSKPKLSQSDGGPTIMRKRQFMKRNYWYKKFGVITRCTSDDKLFFKELDELSSKIVKDCDENGGKDVIDLVSSEEEQSLHDEESIDMDTVESHDNEDVVVVVPNSDSEDENYFANFKPKCSINKTKLQEKLILTLQEAFFLLYGLGCLQIVNNNKLLNIQQSWDLFARTDKAFVVKYVVYHYFRSKGYVVKPGIKFGGDYLLYKEGPGVTHADYIVVLKCEGETYDWTSILGHIRMAVTTVKEIIIAEVINEKQDTQQLPEGLNNYSVRVVTLSRKTFMNQTIKFDD